MGRRKKQLLLLYTLGQVLTWDHSLYTVKPTKISKECLSRTYERSEYNKREINVEMDRKFGNLPCKKWFAICSSGFALRIYPSCLLAFLHELLAARSHHLGNSSKNLSPSPHPAIGHLQDAKPRKQSGTFGFRRAYRSPEDLCPSCCFLTEVFPIPGWSLGGVTLKAPFRKAISIWQEKSHSSCEIYMHSAKDAAFFIFFWYFAALFVLVLYKGNSVIS